MTSFLVYPEGAWVTVTNPPNEAMVRGASRDSICVTTEDKKRISFGVGSVARKKVVDVVKGETTSTGVFVKIDEHDNAVLEANGEQTITKYDTITTDTEDDREAFIVTWKEGIGNVNLTYYTPAVTWKPVVDITTEGEEKASVTLSAMIMSDFWSPVEGSFELIMRQKQTTTNIDGDVSPLDISVGELNLEHCHVKPISFHSIPYQTVNMVELTTNNNNMEGTTVSRERTSSSNEGQAVLTFLARSPCYLPGARCAVTYLKHKEMVTLPSHQKDSLMVVPLYKSRSVKYSCSVTVNGKEYTVRVRSVNVGMDTNVFVSFDTEGRKVTGTKPAVQADLTHPTKLRWLCPCKKGEITETFTFTLE